MPQASDELRSKMESYFGDPINDWSPTAFLLDQGYTEKGGFWTKPEGHLMTEKEGHCLAFLREEWDHDFEAIFQ
jgi:hypothetical protein